VAVRIAAEHSTFYNTVILIKVQSLSGDNPEIVNNSIITQSCLSNCFNTISYHGVLKQVQKRLLFSGKENPEDNASKHWAYPHMWNKLKPILSISGDRNDLHKEDHISHLKKMGR
jgi:hypothetical protein